jgi:hypothetical protein
MLSDQYSPLFQKLFGNAQRRIGMSTDRNIRDIQEQGAQSGFRGVNTNQINDAYKNEEGALSQVSDSLTGQQLDMEKFLQELQFQKDSQPAWWEGLLGGLIGAGGQIGAAALTGGASKMAGIGSDKKLKKNIKKVAKTDEGIPVVKFNYKEGGKAEHIGFLSKDVKKKHPEAVREVVDYSKVPMKISKLLAA